jgi:hypothetical protein
MPNGYDGSLTSGAEVRPDMSMLEKPPTERVSKHPKTPCVFPPDAASNYASNEKPSSVPLTWDREPIILDAE